MHRDTAWCACGDCKYIRLYSIQGEKLGGHSSADNEVTNYEEVLQMIVFLLITSASPYPWSFHGFVRFSLGLLNTSDDGCSPWETRHWFPIRCRWHVVTRAPILPTAVSSNKSRFHCRCPIVWWLSRQNWGRGRSLQIFFLCFRSNVYSICYLRSSILEICWLPIFLYVVKCDLWRIIVIHLQVWLASCGLIFTPSICVFVCCRLSKYRWPGCERQLWTSGPDPGFKVDQWEHRLLRRRLQPHHRVRFWDRGVLRQPAHPLPPLWR